MTLLPGQVVQLRGRNGRGSTSLLRLQVKYLPASFTLDDSLSMSPAARLSAVGQVVVGARISKSGQAMPQPGDLESVSAPMAVGSAGVALVIDSAVK